MNQKQKNDALEALLKMRVEAKRDSALHVVLSDALEREEAKGMDSTGEALAYLQDVCQHGCISGTCDGLIYYSDTQKFYQKHNHEADEVLAEYESNTGEAYKFDGRDVQNTLAWMLYEETARKILDEVTPDM